ncbi:MAG: hypothetical protein HOV80_28010 [Polyangiaceae bacterium]|nr:hypothetical protein [Polyangiaceae bacterium]
MAHRALWLGLSITLGCSGAATSPPSSTQPASAAAPKSTALASASASATPAKAEPKQRYAGSKFDVDPTEPLPRGAVARCGTTKMRAPVRSAVAVTDDGHVYALATGSSSRELRELTKGITTTLDVTPYEAVFSPDATRLVLRRSYSDAKVTVLDVPSGKVVGELTIDLKKGKPGKNAFVFSGTEYIENIRYSPDGSLFFVLTTQGKLVVADGRTGKVVRTRQLPHGTLLDVSADGSRGLVLTSDPPPKGRAEMISLMSTRDSTGYVVLDLASGATLRKEQFKLEKTEDPRATKFREHWTASFALDLDGRSVYRLEHGDLDAIDVASGKTRSVVKRDRSDLFSGFGGFGGLGNRTIELHPNGLHAIIDDQLVDLETGAKGRKFDHSLAAISKNHRTVVLRDGAVLLIDGVETREGHTGAISELGFLPEGRGLVAADGKLHFWDVGSCDQVAKPGLNARGFRMAQAAPLLAIDGYPTLFVDGAGKVTKMKQTLRQDSMALAPDGSRIYGGLDNYDEGSEIVAFDLEGKPQKRTGVEKSVNRLAISPGGTRLAVSSGYGEDAKFEIRRTSDLGVEASSSDDMDRVFFAREDRLIRHGYSGVTVIEVPSLKELERFRAGACCQQLAVSKDGKRIAGSWDETINVWELDPVRFVTTLRGHTGKVTALAFSPDGTTLASGSEDTTILLWDIASPPKPEVDRAAKPVASGPASLDRWSTGYHAGAAFVRDDGTLAVTGRLATPPPALRDVKKIAGGTSATCVLAGGGVSCWGSTGGGILGIPEEKGATKYGWKERATPVAVPTVTDAVALDMWTAYACAKEKAGALVCWGRLGEPGNDAPRRVLERVSEFGLGWNQACALRNDGDVMCWSGGGATPVVVPGAPKASHLALGDYHACAVGKDKRVYCWGQGMSGQMGDGLGRDWSKPTAVEGLSDVVAIAAHGSATCVRTEKDDVFCWGDFGSRDQSLSIPTLIKGLRGTKGLAIFEGERACAESKNALVCVDVGLGR